MSTNKTPNYNLHSWLPQDEFHVSEINENFALLDRELALETESLQDTFADEVAELKTALADSAAFVTGTYAGDRAASRTIEVGRPIKALLLESSNGTRGSCGGSSVAGGLCFPGRPLGSAESKVTVDGTRFHVTISDRDPYLNLNNCTYVYLAWVDMT